MTAVVSRGKVIDVVSQAVQQLQAGNSSEAIELLGQLKGDAIVLSDETQDLLQRLGALQDHYKAEVEETTRKIGDLSIEKDHQEGMMRSAKIDLQGKESALCDLRRQLSMAKSDRDSARRERENRAQSKKIEMTGVAVGVGILGVVLTIATAGAAAPLAVGATVACGISGAAAPLAVGAGATVAYGISGAATPLAVGATVACRISAAEHAMKEAAANRDIDMYNRKISDVQNGIASSRHHISGIESQIMNLQRNIQELEQRCRDNHEEKGRIQDAIASLQESHCFWGKFSNDLEQRSSKTELLHHLLEMAEEKKKRNFLKRRGSQILVMSFVNAWERLRDDIQSGSGFIFSISFICIQCKQKFTALPFAKNRQFICAGCHRAICE